MRYRWRCLVFVHHLPDTFPVITLSKERYAAFHKLYFIIDGWNPFLQG